MVYDGADTVTGYLDNEAFGSSSVNYANRPLSMICIGYFASNNDKPGESIRGLWGEIDAVSISSEALGATEFRLLGGGPSAVETYELY